MLGPNSKGSEQAVYLPSFLLFCAHSLSSFSNLSQLWCFIMIFRVLRTGGKGGEGVRIGRGWVQIGDLLFLETFF